MEVRGFCYLEEGSPQRCQIHRAPSWLSHIHPCLITHPPVHQQSPQMSTYQKSLSQCKGTCVCMCLGVSLSLSLNVCVPPCVCCFVSVCGVVNPTRCCFVFMCGVVDLTTSVYGLSAASKHWCVPRRGITTFAPPKHARTKKTGK
jgi:hypothetical protein